MIPALACLAALTIEAAALGIGTANPSVPHVGATGSAPVAAFTSHQIWDTDNGSTIDRLGLKQQGLYVIRRNSQVVDVPFKNDFGVDEAALAPQGDLVAYTGHSGDNGMQFRVVIADLSGREMASFRAALHPRWSSDGECLAMHFLHYDRAWKVVYDSVGFWQRSDGSFRSYRQRPRDIRWGARDSLFLGLDDGVGYLDRRSGRVGRTNHRWAMVSSDGRFSVGYGGQWMEYYHLQEETPRLELWGCAMEGLGYSDMGSEAYVPEPFWLRAPGAGHLLCVSGSGSHTSPAAQSGCVTAVFDPRTLDFIRRIAGKLVAPTADGSGVVVLRGDTLSVVDLSGLRDPTPLNPRRARVKVEVQPWSWGRRGSVSTWIHEVQEGDWLPDYIGQKGGCQRMFRVDRIAADSVYVRVLGAYVTRSDSVLPLTLAPLRLATASMDGGYDLSLSVVPGPGYAGADANAAGPSERVRLENTTDGQRATPGAVSGRSAPPEGHYFPPELEFAADSLSLAAEDSSRAGWVLEKLRPIEAKYPRNTFTPQIKFRALLASSAPVGELTAAADTLLFAETWGRHQPQGDFASHICLDVANALLQRHLSLPVAALYAQRAIRYAQGTETWLGGYSLRVLAQVQRAVGQPDSAIATLRFAIADLNEYYNETLIKDMQFDLGALLESRWANDEAIGAYFASAAMDPNDSLIAVGPLRNLWSRRDGTPAELDSRIAEARRLWGDWRQGMSYGDLWKDRATGKWYSPAPDWELKDFAGKTVRSQELKGTPYALIFWGSWSQANREIARLAASWVRQTADFGVRVIGANWELPGDSPASARIAQDFMRRERLQFPVVLDSRQKVFKSFNGRNYPQIFFIDRNGLVHQTTIGYVPEWRDSLNASLKALRRE